MAICLDRTLGLIVGLLGILKAGGAYAPLDRAHPKERFALTLSEANARVLITDGRLASDTVGDGVTVIRADGDREVIRQFSPDNPECAAGADNLAYIMYTSGSTGRPKGVSIPHRGVVRLVSQDAYARFEPSEVILQIAPITFEASTFEIFIDI